MSVFRIGFYTDHVDKAWLRPVLAPIFETFKTMNPEGGLMIDGEKVPVFDPPRPNLVALIKNTIAPETTIDTILAQIRSARDSIDGLRPYRARAADKTGVATGAQGGGQGDPGYPVLVAEKDAVTPVTVLSDTREGGAMLMLALALDFWRADGTRVVLRDLHPKAGQKFSRRLWQAFVGADEPDAAAFHEAPEAAVSAQVPWTTDVPVVCRAPDAGPPFLREGFAIFGDRSTPLLDQYLPHLLQRRCEAIDEQLRPDILTALPLDVWRRPGDGFLARVHAAFVEIQTRRPAGPLPGCEPPANAQPMP